MQLHSLVETDPFDLDGYDLRHRLAAGVDRLTRGSPPVRSPVGSHDGLRWLTARFERVLTSTDPVEILRPFSDADGARLHQIYFEGDAYQHRAGFSGACIGFESAWDLYAHRFAAFTHDRYGRASDTAHCVGAYEGIAVGVDAGLLGWPTVSAHPVEVDTPFGGHLPHGIRRPDLTATRLRALLDRHVDGRLIETPGWEAAFVEFGDDDMPHVDRALRIALSILGATGSLEGTGREAAVRAVMIGALRDSRGE